MTARVNLADLLLEHPFADDEPLLVDAPSGARLTAGEAKAAVRALADTLRAAGVRRGQAVAVHLPDSPRVIVTMAAIWHIGAVFVPLNPRAPDAEVARVVAATQPALLVRDGTTAPLDGPVRSYDDGVAFVLFTSGTTGAPKPILHTHRAYLEIIDRVLTPLRAAPTSVRGVAPNLIPVGLTLNSGIYNTLFGLRAGAAIIVLGSFEPAHFARVAREFAIRSTVLPPAAIAALAGATDVDDLTPLRYVRSITAPLAPRVARRFTERFGAFVLNSYGQAELGEVIGWTATDAKQHPEKLGAAGRPLPGVDVRLADVDADTDIDADTDAGAGGVGRLLVRPPSRAAGVVQEHLDGEDDLTARTDADGFVDTGDLARIDADGFVWIEGRRSDVINRGGNKVFPDDVEAVLCAVAGVRDAAVVGAPDERLGQVPVAFVVADATVTDDQLEHACRAELVPYKVPVAFHRVGTLPRNEAGKLLRRELSGPRP